MSSLYVQTTAMTRMPTALPPLRTTEGVAAAPRLSQTGVGVSRRPVCPSLYLYVETRGPKRAGRSMSGPGVLWELAPRPPRWLRPPSAMAPLEGDSPLS